MSQAKLHVNPLYVHIRAPSLSANSACLSLPESAGHYVLSFRFVNCAIQFGLFVVVAQNPSSSIGSNPIASQYNKCPSSKVVYKRRHFPRTTEFVVFICGQLFSSKLFYYYFVQFI